MRPQRWQTRNSWVRSSWYCRVIQWCPRTPAAKARQPVSHHPALLASSLPTAVLDLRLVQLRFSPCRTVEGVQTRTPWSVQTMISVAVPPLSIVDSRSIRRTVAGCVSVGHRAHQRLTVPAEAGRHPAPTCNLDKQRGPWLQARRGQVEDYRPAVILGIEAHGELLTPSLEGSRLPSWQSRWRWSLV
jgi:hypothetical protein